MYRLPLVHGGLQTAQRPAAADLAEPGVHPGSHRHLTPPASGVEFFLPVHCQHCEKAPCEKVCPVGATFKAADGAVLIDYERCIGCRYCMSACPYGVRQFNWEDPAKAHQRSEYQEQYHYGYPEDHRHEGRLVYSPLRPKGIVEKCTFCAQYRDNGSCRPVSGDAPARPGSSAIFMIRRATSAG